MKKKQGRAGNKVICIAAALGALLIPTCIQLKIVLHVNNCSQSIATIAAACQPHTHRNIVPLDARSWGVSYHTHRAGRIVLRVNTTHLQRYFQLGCWDLQE